MRGLLDTFVPSRATKQFDDPSQVKARGEIDKSKYGEVFEAYPELDNPYSAVALPQDIIEAMELERMLVLDFSHTRMTQTCLTITPPSVVWLP